MRLFSVSLVVGLVVVLLAVPSLSQNDPQVSLEGGVIGGGPILAWQTLNLRALNAVLEQRGFSPLNGRIWLWGVQGGAGVLAGSRVGGQFRRGRLEAQQGQKISRLELDYLGLTGNFGLMLNDEFGLEFGNVVGGGRALLVLADQAPASFDDAVTPPSQSGSDFYLMALQRYFIELQPKVSLIFLQSDRFAMRFSGGYSITFGQPWRLGSQRYPGPPGNFNGWIAQGQFAVYLQIQPPVVWFIEKQLKVMGILQEVNKTWNHVTGWWDGLFGRK